MAKKHKVHRNPNAWKKDIQVLTCLLRLRCQPPVPYSTIANILLKTKPSLMLKLSKKVAPSDVTLDEGMADWMEKYLEEVYDNLEKWESEPWKLARVWNEGVVREMLRVAGLDMTGGGFEVMDEAELALQVKWKRNGDWRAGSIPMGKPTKSSAEDSCMVSSKLGTLLVWTTESAELRPRYLVNISKSVAELSMDTPKSKHRELRYSVDAQLQKSPPEPVAPAGWTNLDEGPEGTTQAENALNEGMFKRIGVHLDYPASGYHGDEGWTEMRK